MEITRDRKKMLTLGGAALAAVLVGGVLLTHSPDGSDEKAAVSAEAPEGEEAAEKGGEQHAEGLVEMTPERIQTAGIRTEKVTEGTLGAEILAQATVTAPPEGRSSLAARADGAVTRIFKRLGDNVAAGETIAILESREAAGIVAERSSAQARAQAARSALAREQRLFNAKITARQDLEAAQSANAQAQAELRRTQAAVAAAGVSGDGRSIAVRSLISGRITKVDAELGAFVSAGTELFEVANPRSVQIEAAVPAPDAQRIRPGDPGVIELPGGGTLDAVVRSSTPAVNVESRAATIVLSPIGTPAGLVQGQSLRARISPRGAATNGRIVLPEEAVQSVEGRDVVFVRVAKGFQATPVTVGSRSGGRVEILSGLRAGSEVVTTGAFVMKSELGASEAEH
ncbi:efflux RND transporter periplasmic adaptor subunit [Sphingomonas parva]|uniref:Efflux RND transporter periplasmic adaptor subunit n=1 Tax=Sphingomonas parva TaxID=2555898 RepID=A0A4Y8ZY15_9SPHN|nr:efflux RND transporter periplasmic adaptor subunit [Sphingomonas parva]TFI59789.1 efflux RND transporter periplasmic adaptor subunit [Sphingomonas parva]